MLTGHSPSAGAANTPKSLLSNIHQRTGGTLWLNIYHSALVTGRLSTSITKISVFATSLTVNDPHVCHHDVPLHPQVGAGDWSGQASWQPKRKKSWLLINTTE